MRSEYKQFEGVSLQSRSDDKKPSKKFLFERWASISWTKKIK